MDLKCECGRAFRAPDDARQAQCPACGRLVKAGGPDWLGALDAEDLELDVKEEAPPEPPEPPPVVPAQEAPPPPPPPEGPAPVPGEPEEVEPRGLLGFFAMVRDEPFVSMGFLRRGLRGSRFLAELAVATGALALVWAFTAAKLAGEPAVGRIAGNLVRFLVELGAASVMLALLALLLKRDPAERPHPIGVAEGVVLTRLLGLAVAVLVGIALALAVSLTGGPEHAPQFVQWLARHVQTLYTVIAFAAQTSYVMGLLNLGCLPGLAVSIVVSYGAATLAGG
jgi:hypothetical protein